MHGLPQAPSPARFLLSPAWEDFSLFISQGAGGAQGRIGQQPWEEGATPATPGERSERPGSLAPAAVMGTPSPIYFSTSLFPFLPSVVFLCQQCRFYFIPFFPFSQRNKGLEVVGAWVLVIGRWRGAVLGHLSLPFPLREMWLLDLLHHMSQE